jgi:thiol:disulfide interchange protein DsbD
MPQTGGDGDESGRIAAALKDAGFWANLAFFFLAGLGLSLTPCVFPMIPILSGIIAGQGHKATRTAAVLRCR